MATSVKKISLLSIYIYTNECMKMSDLPTYQNVCLCYEPKDGIFDSITTI